MSDPANDHPRDALSAYLDDELGVDERATIDRHLAACEDCRGELEALRQLARAVADDDVPTVPVDLAARIGRRVDAATIVCPRRSRFVLPATIAATLGAIGILVALQWREGRLVAPIPPEPTPQRPVLDETKAGSAPSPPVTPEETVAPRKEEVGEPPHAVFDKDVDQQRKRSEPDVSAGVSGGVPAGVVGGVEGQSPSEATGDANANDERGDRGTRESSSESGFSRPAPPAAPDTAAKAVALPPCMDRWSDSGVHGLWEVQDLRAAERELGRIAHAVGGIGLWRGVAEGRPYIVVVPRGGFEQVVFALRARGVTGLPEAPSLGEGADCTGISVTLNVVPATTSPAPR